jgi:hypothetical protein
MAADDCLAQSFMDRLRSNWNAMQETYPTPDALAGDPASTGLLLVEGYFTWAGGRDDLEGVAIVGADAPDHRILAGAVSWRMIGGRTAAPFVGLAPGVYSIQRLKFSGGGDTRIMDAPETPELAVEVRAGELSYIGQVHASQRMFSTTINIEVANDRARELEAWRHVLERYRSSAWAPLIEARVARLSAAAPSEAH